MEIKKIESEEQLKELIMNPEPYLEQEIEHEMGLIKGGLFLGGGLFSFSLYITVLSFFPQINMLLGFGIGCACLPATLLIDFIGTKLLFPKAERAARENIKRQIEELKMKNEKEYKISGEKLGINKHTTDPFIILLHEIISKVGRVKYEGFIHDLHTLLEISEKYLKEKSNKEPTILFQHPEWFQTIIKIATRAKEEEVNVKNQASSIKALKITIEALKKEKIDLENISTPISSVTAKEETTGNNGIVLTLGGK